MALWTDIIDPATLTGYARAAAADYEARRGTLARWLPNRTVADIAVRFIVGSTGLVEVARFRAYDAEIEVGRRPEVQRKMLELPALGTNLPVSEYEQIRGRSGQIEDAAALATIQNTTIQAVRSVADAAERLRGITLATGNATVDQGNFGFDDDFGRPAGHTVTAPALWSVGGTDAIAQLETFSDTYSDANGADPGVLLMSTRAFRAMANLDQFQMTMANGGSRPATAADVRAVIETAGLPPIELYDRRVNVDGVTTRALPDDLVLMLPAPVDPNDFMGTELGATFWGRTLSSTEPGWEIPLADQPGIVAGVWRHEKPPMGIEVIADAIGEPVLANAALSFAITVL